MACNSYSSTVKHEFQLLLEQKFVVLQFRTDLLL